MTNFPFKTKYLALVIISFIQTRIAIIGQEVTDLSEYRWTIINAKGEPTPRHENVFVEFEGKFYLLAGRGINPVDVFDPETNTWTKRGKSPMEIHHFQPVVYKDAIYIVGAMTGKYPKETPLTHVWKYFPKTDTWEKGHEIPVNRRRGGAGAVVYKNKIYIACGIDCGHTSGTNNLFDCYDPESGEWESLTKAPHIRDHFPAIVVKDKLYLVGGRNTSFHTKNKFAAFFGATTPWVDVYDFKTKSWITLENQVPFPTAAGGVFALDNKIIYAGGEGGIPSAYQNTQCLDLQSGNWSQLAPLQIGRHGTSAVKFKNEVFIAAGSPNRGGGNMNSIEKFSKNHGWKPLFNGTDLTGWEVKCTKPDKDKSYWKTENGVIAGNTNGNSDHGYIWLQTVEEYSDFELRFKVQFAEGTKGNSGIQIRSRYDKKAKIDGKSKGWFDGPQVDIDPVRTWRTGLIYDETRTEQRWIYPSLQNSTITTEHKPKRSIFYKKSGSPSWNDIRIVCKGVNIKSYLNNILISDFYGDGTVNNQEHNALNVGTKGHIALQIHKKQAVEIRFKDIEIREF